MPLVIVHGGGREIDAALARAGIAKRQVDGLRITDEPTLDIVVGVLAGLINTRLVAALGAAGVRAVGLTGADAGVGRVEAAKPHVSTTGAAVDLGRVGEPVGKDRPALVDDLKKSADDFRRKDLFAFRAYDATHIELTRGKDTVAFDKTKGADAAAGASGAGTTPSGGGTSGVGVPNGANGASAAGAGYSQNPAALQSVWGDSKSPFRTRLGPASATVPATILISSM